jgi:hypothetical protein
MLGTDYGDREEAGPKENGQNALVRAVAAIIYAIPSPGPTMSIL